MNFYDRIALIRKMGDREKIDMVHELFVSLHKNRNEHLDYEPFLQWLDKIKEADEIYNRNNQFYTY